MYIGKTEHINPLDRWKEHLDDRKREQNQKRPFYRALNKYDPENFTFEVIDSTDDSNELCELEKKYIQLYRTYVHYNTKQTA